MTDCDTDEGDSEQPLGSVLAKYIKKLLHTAKPQDRSRSYAYRGQHKACWPLRSAAVRRLILSNQQEGARDSTSVTEQILLLHMQHLLREFRNRGYDIVDGLPQSDLECLSTLQHQGAATALLDFSYSPLVALWFASHEGDTDTDGKVFKMDITTCQTNTFGDKTATVRTFETILGGLRYPRENLAWQPPSVGDSRQRVLAQQSVHLLCKHDPEQQNSVSNRHLTDFVIAAPDKQRLQEDLRAVGIDETALFPDLGGFADTNRSETPLRLPDPRDLLSEANSAYNSQDFDLAADLYSHYLDAYPDDSEVKLLLTNAMVDARHPHEAADLLLEIESWAQSHLSNPAKSNFYFNKANVEAQLGNHRSAIVNYTTSLQLCVHLGTYFNRANSYASIGDYDNAIADYQLCPDSTNAMFNAGNSYVAKFDFESAEERFAAAVQLEPAQGSYQQNLNNIRRVRLLIDGRQYDPRMEYRTRGTDSPTVLIFLKYQGTQPGPTPQVFPLVGNAGNQGNTGFQNLRGGRGFHGSIGNSIWVILVRDEPQDEEQSDD